MTTAKERWERDASVSGMIRRILVIIVAYLAAAFVASIVIALLLMDKRDPVRDFLAIGSWAVIFVTVFATIPAIGVIIYAEVRRVKSPVFYACAGFLVPVVITAAHDLLVFVLSLGDLSAFAFITTIAPAGVAGGLTYWAIVSAAYRRLGLRGCGCDDAPGGKPGQLTLYLPGVLDTLAVDVAGHCLPDPRSATVARSTGADSVSGTGANLQ